MQYRKLGDSGLEVSALCLGAMTFGEPESGQFMHGVGAPVETAEAIMNRAYEAGVNMIDTADVYGQDGLSEKIVGDYLERTGRRQETVLATKFRFRMHKGPNGQGGSRRYIMQAAEASLRRLKTDYLDLYQIHMQDEGTPEEETLRALDDLITQGKVLYIGASNYTATRLTDSCWTARVNHLHRFVALQAHYNLLVREIEREHIPACSKHGLGIIAWSPLASGMLSGKYQRGKPAPADSRLSVWDDTRKRYDNEKAWTVVDALREVAAELDVSGAQVALAWLLSRPRVASAIVGARTLAQLDDNLAAAQLTLSTEQLEKLNRVSALELCYPYNFLARTRE